MMIREQHECQTEDHVEEVTHGPHIQRRQQARNDSEVVLNVRDSQFEDGIHGHAARHQQVKGKIVDPATEKDVWQLERRVDRLHVGQIDRRDTT